MHYNRTQRSMIELEVKNLKQANEPSENGETMKFQKQKLQRLQTSIENSALYHPF